MRSDSRKSASSSALDGTSIDVVGPIVRGRAVVVAAGRLEQRVELAFLDVLRSLEHEVLEQVREAGSPRLLVGGADVVPDVDGDHGHALVLMQDHGQPVGEPELAIRHLQRSRRLGARRLRSAAPAQ